MNRMLKVIVGVIGLAIILWVSVTIWNECRDAGHSVLYCMRVVSR